MKIKIKLSNGITDFKKKIKKYSFPICCVIGIIGIILFVYPFFLIVTDYQKEQNSVKTLATITSLNYMNDSYIGMVSYSVEDVLYEKTVTLKDNSFTVNDKIEIKYNKDNPNQLIENNHILQIICSFLISLICLKLGIFSLLKDYIKNKKIVSLRENGILIYADVDSVFINNKAKKKKGKFPYRIRLKYQNPMDRCLYTYESLDIYFDIKTIMETKGVLRLPVYLNKENTYEYYIDIEFLLKEN